MAMLVKWNPSLMAMWNPDFEGSTLPSLKIIQPTTVFVMFQMPRKAIVSKPKVFLKKWQDEEMIKAIISVRNKEMGLKKACKLYNVPHTTLQRFVNSGKIPEECVNQSVGRKPVLPHHLENVLVEYLIDMDNRFYGLTREDVKRMAYQVAVKNNIPHPFTNEAAGRAWFDLFIRRHQHKLTIHKPIGTSFSRANGFNKDAVNKFFDLLTAEYEKHSYAADRVFNVDETGLSVVQSKIPRVVGLKGKRQVGAITSAERGSLVTVICCMSASGIFVPPMMIFPRKNFSEVLMKGAPAGSIGRCHPSGWIQAHLFTEWFEHFVKKTNPTEKSPVLLILDGHNTHTKNIHVIDFARENNVTIVSLPPHTSHKMQPLDKTFMGCLKTYYSEFVRQWMRHNNRPLGQYDIAELFGKAYLQSQTGAIAAKGFQKTGIFPCDRTVFGDDDFIASTAPCTPNLLNQATTTTSPTYESIEALSVNNSDMSSGGHDVNFTTLACSSKSLSNRCDEESVNVSPYDIMPVPPPKKKSSTRGRKPSSCAVITSSPYKAGLIKKPANFKEKGSRSTQKISKPKANKNTAKKIKKKLHFEDDSDEESRQSVSSKESDLELPADLPPAEEDALCMFCSEKFSNDNTGELWVMCMLCSHWSHSACAGWDQENYVCDFCK